MASKLCDSCKSATATLYCKPDTAFLCLTCDSRVHAANKLSSRHARVWLCEVCEQAPAQVTCKADAASLCHTCDLDIHSANPLAFRHDRLLVSPFFDSPVVKPSADELLRCLAGDVESEVETVASEAAEWLLPKVVGECGESDLDSGRGGELNLFDGMDPYLDLDYAAPPVDLKEEEKNISNSVTDCVVPVQNRTGHDSYELDFTTGSKNLAYSVNSNSRHRLYSSSILEVGVVPDGGTTMRSSSSTGVDQAVVVQLSRAEREARVLRYREKRKNRRFEKTIRYASRKAYAEVRPRIKGRFAKRTDFEVDDVVDTNAAVFGFGIVPSF